MQIHAIRGEKYSNVLRNKKNLSNPLICGQKKIYSDIKQINCNNIFLEIQFVFLNHTKTYT